MNKQPASPTASVLVVDDTPANVDLLRNILKNDYVILSATSGEEALKVAHETPPDLILLDVVMPGIDGLETCRRLKASPETGDIPVIFVTARSDSRDIVAGFEVGAVDYISRPIRRQEVCARVRTHVHMRRNADALREQAERFRAVVTNMSEGLLIIDPRGRVQFANSSAASALGYVSDELLVGLSLFELLTEPARQEYLSSLSPPIGERQARDAHGPREVTLKRRDGSLLTLDLTVTPIFLAKPMYIALLHDSSRHKEVECELLQQTRIDPLTDIYNRRHFDAVLKSEWQRATRSGVAISLMVLDIDHFKLYNDTFGHYAGDRCLQLIAQVLKANARRPTDLAARIGGEEFVLLFPDTGRASALMLAERVRSDIEGLNLPHPRSSAASCVTASIGVATMLATHHESRQLFIAADEALYRAKEWGRNWVEAAGP